VNRLPLSLWLVIALLIVATLLITVPAQGAPSSADVCNASTFEYRDQLDAEKSSAAKVVLIGGLVSLAAAITAFVSVSGRTRSAKLALIATGMLGVFGVVSAVGVAFVTGLVIC
jgi:hypothetical protein